MTECTVDKRHRCRAAAELVGADPRVESVDILHPGLDSQHEWTIEVTLTCGGLPPGVMQGLARHQITVDDVRPQGPDHYRVVGVLG